MVQSRWRLGFGACQHALTDEEARKSSFITITLLNAAARRALSKKNMNGLNYGRLRGLKRIFLTESLVDLSSHSALSVLASNSDSLLLWADGRDVRTDNAQLNVRSNPWSLNMDATSATTSTPEPTTAAMTALSLIGSGLVFRRKFKI